MKKITFAFTPEDITALEAIRAKLGLRSMAAVIRHWIRSYREESK